MTEEEARSLARRAFAGLGLGESDAADAAEILLLGDLFGHHTHGLSRIESYGERIELGGIDPAARVGVEQVGAALARIDGVNGVGPVVGMRALRCAMELARAGGVGLALARHSNHFGAIAPYCHLAAQQGFASIIGSNATTTIAPTGGSQARLGNSPLGFGVPHPGGEPIILDMAMSVVARAKIREALKRGEAIPEAWATDREGRPTTDPRAALEGFLQPIGGYKGYGLALVVDLFAGLLSGASYLTHVKSWSEEPGAPQDLGHFFLLVDTERLGSTDWLRERMQDFAGILRSTPPSDPRQPVMLPGEREHAALARQRRAGVELEGAVVAKLEAFAARAARA
ncbi:MAG TPA: Ldh family oxidoreductase [Usitatibacter sp.]|nr:Ldh family oxidoreductase [Usitatibacter sp.]